jgi:hypothetical protein
MPKKINIKTTEVEYSSDSVSQCSSEDPIKTTRRKRSSLFGTAQDSFRAMQVLQQELEVQEQYHLKI